MSAVLVVEMIESNFNQHLLLFQHIPLVKGNDYFPATGDSDIDMNLDVLAFQPLQVSLSSFRFCFVLYFLTTLSWGKKVSGLYGISRAIRLFY